MSATLWVRPVATFTGKEDRDYLLRAFAHQGEELQPSPELKVIEITTAGLGPQSPECQLDLIRSRDSRYHRPCGS